MWILRTSISPFWCRWHVDCYMELLFLTMWGRQFLFSPFCSLICSYHWSWLPPHTPTCPLNSEIYTWKLAFKFDGKCSALFCCLWLWQLGRKVFRPRFSCACWPAWKQIFLYFHDFVTKKHRSDVFPWGGSALSIPQVTQLLPSGVSVHRCCV